MGCTLCYFHRVPSLESFLYPFLTFLPFDCINSPSFIDVSALFKSTKILKQLRQTFYNTASAK